MKKHYKEILKLTAKELLSSLFDLSVPFFSASRVYKRSANKYLEERSVERSEFIDKIKYWKRHGYVSTYVEGKENYVELTQKGHDYLKNASPAISIKRPDIWDGKWRIVIFDIPEKFRASRDALRFKLAELDFYQIQKSVYVYPFECTEAIRKISKHYLIEEYVLIMISEIIQGEESIIEQFLDKNILIGADLKKGKSSRS